jgi:hypothetical protein
MVNTILPFIHRFQSHSFRLPVWICLCISHSHICATWLAQIIFLEFIIQIYNISNCNNTYNHQKEVTTRIMKINTILSQNIWFLWTCKSTDVDKYILSPAKQAENTYHGSSYSRKMCSNYLRYNFWLLAMERLRQSHFTLLLGLVI